MTKKEFMKQCFRGGPGLDGYAYRADVYCPNCAEEIGAGLEVKLIKDTNDPIFCDSEKIPQPIFFGEAEAPYHCNKCNKYLYGNWKSDNEEDN